MTKDCKNCRYSTGGGKFCYHPSQGYHNESGGIRWRTCNIARRAGYAYGICGPEARLFEPIKDEVDKAPAWIRFLKRCFGYVVKRR